MAFINKNHPTWTRVICNFFFKKKFIKNDFNSKSENKKQKQKQKTKKIWVWKTLVLCNTPGSKLHNFLLRVYLCIYFF